MKKIGNETLTTDAFYNLQNIYEVVVALGEGEFTIEELVLTVDNLFTDLSAKEKKELCIRTLKIINIIIE